VEGTLEQVIGPAGTQVLGVQKRRPERLPSTGVGSEWLLALVTLAGAFGTRRWMGRAS
jgi:MYXO-CTERM domain-containing protein